jgi:hypothetical protein
LDPLRKFRTKNAYVMTHFLNFFDQNTWTHFLFSDPAPTCPCMAERIYIFQKFMGGIGANSSILRPPSWWSKKSRQIANPKNLRFWTSCSGMRRPLLILGPCPLLLAHVWSYIILQKYYQIVPKVRGLNRGQKS